MRVLLALLAGGLVYLIGRRIQFAPADFNPSGSPPPIFSRSPSPAAPSEPSVRDSKVSAAQARAIIIDINRKVYSGWFRVPDVLAIIDIESAFDPRALNPEDGLDFSYGLMQIRESSARDRGFSGSVEGLYDPRTNIALGMAHLKWSWDFLVRRGASPSTTQWISSYNAGVGNTLKGFINTGYVRKWQIAKEKYQ